MLMSDSSMPRRSKREVIAPSCTWTMSRVPAIQSPPVGSPSRLETVLIEPPPDLNHGTNRTPSNLYIPWEKEAIQRNPSEACVNENIVAGREPSCVRHEVCRYWVIRLFGSRAVLEPVRSDTQTSVEASVRRNLRSWGGVTGADRQVRCSLIRQTLPQLAVIEQLRAMLSVRHNVTSDASR